MSVGYSEEDDIAFAGIRPELFHDGLQFFIGSLFKRRANIVERLIQPGYDRRLVRARLLVIFLGEARNRTVPAMETAKVAMARIMTSLYRLDDQTRFLLIDCL